MAGASAVAVAFMSVMIGHNVTARPAPVPDHKVTIIEGASAMAVCRRLEANFHIGPTTTYGDMKVSSSKLDDATVRRETSCVQFSQ
uniref:Uncharacterized protein n=1 Tax=Pseudomonas phage RVTF4 TaxID=3236931 RepID=A0AB39CCH4_9VIRU